MTIPHFNSPAPVSETTPVLTIVQLQDAFRTVCHNRRHFPPGADIWHLRFHAGQRLPQILTTVRAGRWLFSPLSLIRRHDGSCVAVWSAEDATVITALTLALRPLLPVSTHCEHLRGHGGGKTSVRRAREAITREGFRFVCRTDIKGYYAGIHHALLYEQLCRYVHHPVLRNLLYQFIHYSTEEGGTFYTPRKGIPRASSLSPLLAAFHLTEIDRHFEQQPHLRYARFMDDFLIFTRTRHHLRRAVRVLNGFLTQYGFAQHPGKTFIGRITRGTDWMGFRMDSTGYGGPAPRAVSNMLQKLRRLYEQTRHLSASQRQARVAQYLTHWLWWARWGSEPAHAVKALLYGFCPTDSTANEGLLIHNAGR